MGWFLAEYDCAPCMVRFEALVERPPPAAQECALCGRLANRVISAAHVGANKVSAVSMGKSDSPPAPTATDTTALGEGMPVKEWKRGRRKLWREYDRKRRRGSGSRP